MTDKQIINFSFRQFSHFYPWADFCVTNSVPTILMAIKMDFTGWSKKLPVGIFFTTWLKKLPAGSKFDQVVKIKLRLCYENVTKFYEIFTKILRKFYEIFTKILRNITKILQVTKVKCQTMTGVIDQKAKTTFPRKFTYLIPYFSNQLIRLLAFYPFQFKVLEWHIKLL